MKDNRTIFELSEKEYEDYENNPDKYRDVTANSKEDALKMIFPNGPTDPDGEY